MCNMAFEKEVVRRFLKDEASSHVRQLLLRHISDCRSGSVHGKRTFEFNQFNVTIDSESNTVTIEDELDADPSGESRCSLEEFSVALWR
jgi:hypothetical protein